MRKATLWLIIIGTAVLIIFVALPFILRNVVSMEWGEVLDYLPFILVGLIQILLSIAVVWYNFLRNPELRILGPDIQPERDGATVALPKYIQRVRFMDKTVEIVKPEPVGPWWKRMSKVECGEMPSKLRFIFDIANVGLSGMTVHDYSFERLIDGEWQSGLIVALFSESYAHLPEYPVEDQNITRVKHEKRVYLEAHERMTDVFDFPWDNSALSKGKHVLQISVYAGSHRKPKVRKKVEVNIGRLEPNRTIITWSR